ncbi:Uncharacterised protein [Serratia fonticola]|jgi:hypothetical protein|nr:Uncharacterised protein [Serratia fonticola]CAI1892948.1 Uncharacterised protein [Serratia fonticola]CAI1940194.1 Uncharacterised protein [Serratia fonticola]
MVLNYHLQSMHWGTIVVMLDYEFREGFTGID